jgi:hypothetical protein
MRRRGKNQAPVELAPAYKNKWANRWTSYWFYAPIAVVGRNSKEEEVISYDLASRMVDLEVELTGTDEGQSYISQHECILPGYLSDYYTGRPRGVCGCRHLAVPTVVWTSLGPLPRWVPGPTTRWAPRPTRLALHCT